MKNILLICILLPAFIITAYSQNEYIYPGKEKHVYETRETQTGKDFNKEKSIHILKVKLNNEKKVFSFRDNKLSNKQKNPFSIDKFAHKTQKKDSLKTAKRIEKLNELKKHPIKRKESKPEYSSLAKRNINNKVKLTDDPYPVFYDIYIIDTVDADDDGYCESWKFEIDMDASDIESTVSTRIEISDETGKKLGTFGPYTFRGNSDQDNVIIGPFKMADIDIDECNLVDFTFTAINGEDMLDVLVPVDKPSYPEIAIVMTANETDADENGYYESWDFDIDIDAADLVSQVSTMITIYDDLGNKTGPFGPFNFKGIESDDDAIIHFDTSMVKNKEPADIYFTFTASGAQSEYTDVWVPVDRYVPPSAIFYDVYLKNEEDADSNGFYEKWYFEIDMDASNDINSVSTPITVTTEFGDRLGVWGPYTFTGNDTVDNKVIGPFTQNQISNTTANEVIFIFSALKDTFAGYVPIDKMQYLSTVLSQPLNNSSGISLNPSLVWNACSGAQSYRLQISLSPDFLNIRNDINNISSTSYSLLNLERNKTYYWRVMTNYSTGTSAWSVVWNFKTIISTPNTPILIIPSGNSTNISVSPVLSWSAVSGASTYHLQVSTSMNFTTFVYDDSNFTSTSKTITGLLNSTSYYWRVNAKNEGGVSPWSAVWSFTTIISAPNVPVLLTPAGNSTNVPINSVLSWNTVSGASTYHLQVSTSMNFTTIVYDDSNFTSTSKTITGLMNNTIYYWRVNARNIGGVSSWSTAWSFKTIISQPQSPALAFPNNGITEVSLQPVLQWNQVDYAETYNLQLSLNEFDWSNLLINESSLNGTTFQINTFLSVNKTYYWRVRAINIGGIGNWSQIWKFSTYSYPLNYNVVNSISFPAYSDPRNYKPSDFKIIGLPGDSKLPVNNLLLGEYEKDWLVYWDNGEKDNYKIKYDGSDIFKFTAGKAFWIMRKDSLKINVSVPTASLNTSGEIEIPIHNGWNLITNPFKTGILWDKIKKLNNDSTPAWSFENGKFEISEKFEPFKGYYYDNRKNFSNLKIPYPVQSFNKNNKISLPFDSKDYPNDSSNNSWKMNITLISDNIEDKSLWLGVNPLSLEGIDDNDFRKPSFSSDLPQTYFSHKEWGKYAGSYATDIRQVFFDIKTWEFVVQSGSANSKLLFSSNSIPPSFQVYLVDESKGKYINLREQQEYKSPGKGDLKFYIIIGKEELVRNKILQVITPENYELGKNYPNPFNPITTIPVKIPCFTCAKVTIYNLLGREVKKLFNGNLSAGIYYFDWNGKDNEGICVASGIYIYRLETSKITLSNKMIFLK
jgi:hypothetical protein